MKTMLFVFTLVLALGALAWPMAFEFNLKNPIVQQEYWPSGLADLLNSPKPVYGWGGNFGSDFFYYEGDSKVFNEFIEAYSKLPGKFHALVLHCGKCMTGSFDMTGKTTIPCDWAVKIAGEPHNPNLVLPQNVTGRDPVVHLWLGVNVDLSKIVVPANVRVESGGEIEKFIREHNAKH